MRRSSEGREAALAYLIGASARAVHADGNPRTPTAAEVALAAVAACLE